MQDAEHDRHLHFERVGEDEGVLGAVPAGVEADPVPARGLYRLDGPAGRPLVGPAPLRRAEAERERKDVVVHDARVDGECAHQENDVPAEVERVEDLCSRVTPPQVSAARLYRQTWGAVRQRTSLPMPFLPNFFSSMMSTNAESIMSAPCPMSPNMTANRNGNVTTVNRPGLTSWYDPIPYASMMFWNPSVNLFVRWNVGGVLVVRSSWRSAETDVPAFSCARAPSQRAVSIRHT